MKILTKIILIVVICITLPISIYYGLRILNSNFTLEYINRSYVITLPNKVWFEIDGGKDTLDENPIFENDNTNLEKTGIDIGPQYPIYKVTTTNKTAKRTQISRRIGDTITLTQNIEILQGEYSTYTTPIYFSQYGTYSDGIYTQEGCQVHMQSEVGKLKYDEEYAILNIEYDISGNKIEDNITIKILCE